MNKYCVVLPLMLLASCAEKRDAQTASAPVCKQVEEVVPEVQPVVLQGDTALQNPAMRCAALVDESSSDRVLGKVDSIMRTDMSDLRKRCQQVFYPFSGPDFLYPFTLFPEADNYVLMGLEPTGTPISNTVLTDSLGRAYARALKVYLHSSFFRTESMKEDLTNEQIDGVLPVITMLMTKCDCQIISVNYNEIDEEGVLKPSDDVTRFVEVHFFQNRTPHHEQVLHFFSGNAANSGLKNKMESFLNGYLDNEHCVCFLKAASYLMYKSYFSRMRTLILGNSCAVIQDDSGIPYRYFSDSCQWDVTLYGTYIPPLKLFGDFFYQQDLDSIYKEAPVRKLGFRIGYNNPSNWMCARKKNSVE